MITQIIWRYTILFLLLFYTTSFIEAKEKTQPLGNQNSTFENLNTEKPDSKRVIGAIENVRLIPPNVVLEARIDTGAKTTSIDAQNITPFERDGKEWVRFDLFVGEKKYDIERKVIKTILIKRHGEDSQRRYVIKMRIVLGDVSQLITVNLNDRESYQYPVLIGRNFLRDYFIVDVGKKFQVKPMALPK